MEQRAINFHPILNQFTPTPYYCEENIWQLVRQIADSEIMPLEQMCVWFITNPERAVPMRYQQAGEGWIEWDYHVILQLPLAGLIIDPASRLISPLNQKIYLQQSFPPPRRLNGRLTIWIRTVPAANYLHHFCSDRRHMVTQSVPEPPWPCIGSEHTDPIWLQHYWDCDREIDGTSWIDYRDIWPHSALTIEG
ncbi:hypothetical protein D5085_00280 [Ectothiorhodospiraceae bacterium BW-2]|nr:hypothetical protein D5085_00280 [Ectothiorhodospiraceae bacterium BW-2]